MVQKIGDCILVSYIASLISVYIAVLYVSLSDTIVFICNKASVIILYFYMTFTMVMILYCNFVTNLLVICLK